MTLYFWVLPQALVFRRVLSWLFSESSNKKKEAKFCTLLPMKYFAETPTKTGFPD
jgi:hypothetical protein